MEKICQACGAKLTKEAKFCNECGTKYVAPVEEKEVAQTLKPQILLRKMVYSVEEAAMSLAISPSKLQQIIAKGEIVICRQGKRVGITEWSLYNYARSHEEGGNDDRGLMTL